MNEYALLHIPDSRFCFAVSEREVVLRLRAAKEDKAVRVFLVYGEKYGYQNRQRETEMEICYTDRLYNYYEKKLTLTDVRLAYVFRLEEGDRICWFSEDGLTETYDFQLSFYNFFQLPYINPNDVMPVVQWMEDTVFYQIFVDRFYRGDWVKDDSYITMPWGGKPTPKNFAGGDLKGITEKLDYLQKLGVGGIYLTPIFCSDSNHKYDISDYKRVDPQFGTNEDLKQLVKAAHSRGIRVVLDAVFNHCSEHLAQFQDVCRRGRKSPYHSWFVIDGDRPDRSKGNYECFAACDYMPKLNSADPSLQDFLLDVALYWIREADIDGWRLDVSDEVSHSFWRRFRQAVKAEKPECLIVGENWHDAYPYLMGDQYDGIMNYSVTKACLDWFAKETLDAKGMAEKLNSILMRNIWQVNQMMLNLLDSHDTLRFYTETGKNRDRLLAAFALLILLPGAACLYYGTEICMEGGFDPDSRRCFDWNEERWDMDVWQAFQSLIALKRHPALRGSGICIAEEDGMLAIRRSNKGKCVWLYINLTKEEKLIPERAGQTPLLHRQWGENLLPDGYVIYEEDVK